MNVYFNSIRKTLDQFSLDHWNLRVMSSSHLSVPPSLRRNCHPVVGMTVWPMDWVLIHPMVLVASEPTIQRPVPETIVAELFLRIRHRTYPENPILCVSLPVDRPSQNNILKVIFAKPSTQVFQCSSLRWNLNSISISIILILMSTISSFISDSAYGVVG